MAYIGNIPAEKYVSLSVQHFTVTATANYTLTNSVASQNEIALFINNVRQEPGGSYAYTAAGTTLTLSAATAATDTMYCVYLGKAIGTVTPPDGSVNSAKIVDGSITNDDLAGSITSAKIADLDAAKLTGTVASARLGTGTADSTKFLRGDGSWQVVSTPVLDSPVISGTLSVLSGGSVSHTITNWSDDVSYTIVPTNCTVGAVNGSGVFVVTHTSGTPSYTIKATTASLGLDDSALVAKNITLQLTAPTLSSPADVGTSTNVTYTITSTTTDDDKLILNIGSSNFTYQSVSVGTASKVGNTVECIGFTTNNPAVVIQYTVEATYSVTATSVKIDGSFGTSAASSADSITIAPPAYNSHFLVVAGGGTGGPAISGGGGAGGLRTSWAGGSGGGASSQAQTQFLLGTVYTCTVGAGGTGNTSTRYTGFSSNITGSGYTTITCTGGGYGYTQTVVSHGGSGGSGDTGGNGTAGEGYAGASDNHWTGAYGGGGGAGGLGTANGPGGVGKQVNIDTNNYYWSGGAGGGGHTSGAGGAGGIGGGGGGSSYNQGGGAGGTSAINSGGAGGSSPTARGGNGGANSGGAGGGCSDSSSGCSYGGSGIIILRMATSDYSGTTSGSPTITTSGSDTIITFLGTGTYTG